VYNDIAPLAVIPTKEIIILLDISPSHKANILKEYVMQDDKIHLSRTDGAV
jgi:hypothetical protein